MRKTIDIPVIDFNDDEVEIFTVSGIRLNCRVKDLIPGLYIINGQKVGQAEIPVHLLKLGE